MTRMEKNHGYKFTFFFIILKIFNFIKSFSVYKGLFEFLFSINQRKIFFINTI